MVNGCWRGLFGAVLVGALCAAAELPGGPVERFAMDRGDLVWGRDAQYWSHIEALGEQAGIWGTGDGVFEAWAYPFKLVSDLTVEYSADGGRSWLSSGELVRYQTARPHAAQLRLVSDQAVVTETLFAPRRLPGVVMLLDVDGRVDLKARVSLKVSLAPMLMGADAVEVSWDQNKRVLHAFEKQRKAEMVVWSPLAVSHESADGVERIVLDIPMAVAGKGLVPIVLAAARPGGIGAAEALEAIATRIEPLYEEAREHFEKVLAEAPRVESPDGLVGEALAWSAVSLDQLRVDNPFVGHGYVSGYGCSDGSTRPGFCWFFDEPTLTSWAFLRQGQADHVREALEFLLRYERDDGKAVHEVTQSLAYYPDYFEKYRFAYIHSSSGTYLIAACGNYCRQTGDVEFIRRRWDGIVKMFGWCSAAVDPNDRLMRVAPNNWGSSESSFSVNKDTQMEGMWVKALKEMQYMAGVMDDGALAERCGKMWRRAIASIEAKLWDEKMGAYLWGVDRAERPLKSLVPLHSVSMWMGSLRADRVERTLERMDRADMRADWGVRGLAASDERYLGDGYQTGAVWPVWNGGVIIADFHAGRVVEGYRNLMAMMRVRRLDGLGPMPEVLNGKYYKRLRVGVPHQMFSECAVVNGFWDGLMGLDVDARGGKVRIGPALPADWDRLSAERIPVGNGRVDVKISRDMRKYELEFTVRGGPLDVTLSPVLEPGAKVSRVRLDGKAVKYDTSAAGCRIVVQVQATKCEGRHKLEIERRRGIDFMVEDEPLQYGQQSSQLRVVKATFEKDTWRFELEGVRGKQYTMRFFTDKGPVRVTGGKTLAGGDGCVRVAMKNPADAEESYGDFVRWKAEVSF